MSSGGRDIRQFFKPQSRESSSVRKRGAAEEEEEESGETSSQSAAKRARTPNIAQLQLEELGESRGSTPQSQESEMGDFEGDGGEEVEEEEEAIEQPVGVAQAANQADFLAPLPLPETLFRVAHQLDISNAKKNLSNDEKRQLLLNFYVPPLPATKKIVDNPWNIAVKQGNKKRFVIP